VDLHERVLVIWDTKFFKSRLVPLGASLAAALAHSATARGPRPGADGDRAPFFAPRSGAAIRLGRLAAAFRRGSTLSTRLSRGPAPRPGAREGADVQARLPLRATSRGQVNVSGTQASLPLTPDLLAEASRRVPRSASPAREADDE
jgi:hypothetical protein